MSYIEWAATYGRARVVEALIAQRALHGAKPSLLDATFVAAVASGNPELVQMVWDAVPERHPALVFNQPDGKVVPQIKRGVSVVMLVRLNISRRQPPEGLAMARWLVAHGAGVAGRDIRGDTLLHMAAESGDVDFVRWVLQQGVPVNVLNDRNVPALGSTCSEDVALALLQAGATPALINGYGSTLMSQAKNWQWQRVVDWLVAHDASGKKRLDVHTSDPSD